MTGFTLTHTITRRVMLDAWSICRKASKRYGHPAKDFIAQALKQAWARMKVARRLCGRAIPQHTPAVYTVCIDEHITPSRKVRDQRAVDIWFTNLAEASLAKAMLTGAFVKPFIKTNTPCFS